MGQLNKDEIISYINKLKELENDLSSGETEDTSFLNDLNEILGRLSTEFNNNVLNSTSDIPVPIKRLNPSAIIPSYSKEGDAGLDLTITTIISESTTKITYGFGIAMAIPKGYVGLVFPRSSVRNYEMMLSNCVGVIDSGYRGEIQATFNKLHDVHNKYEIGDRAAQIMIIPYPKIRFIETEELTKTDRNEGGFGSSGK